MQSSKENRNAQTNDNNGTPTREHARLKFLMKENLTAHSNTLQNVCQRDQVPNMIAISSQGAGPSP